MATTLCGILPAGQGLFTLPASPHEECRACWRGARRPVSFVLVRRRI